MVSMVFADNQVFWAIVILFAIFMVNDCLGWKWFTKNFLGNKDVFRDITVFVCPGVFRESDKDVATTTNIAPSLPFWMKLSAALVPFDKTQGFSFYPPLKRITLLGKISFLTAPALAKMFFFHNSILLSRMIDYIQNICYLQVLEADYEWNGNGRTVLRRGHGKDTGN